MDREIRSILIVDGSASMLFYIGMLLKRLQYKVTTVQSAEDALRSMEDALPSIVVTDIFLPGMSGTELLMRVKNSPRMKSVPVVILSSRSDAELKDECERLGSSGFLCKPVEPDVLYRRLQAVTESIPRANIRVAASLKVVVGAADMMDIERAESTTEISEGGLFVRTLNPRPKDTKLRVRISLPHREISAKAVVLYSFAPAAGSHKEPGMGMKFIEISDADRREIGSFIKNRLVGDIAQ